MAGASQVQAQAGIGVTSDSLPNGLIGTNKGDPGTAPVACPAGSVLTGLFHTDHDETVNAFNTRGMTTGFGVYCSTIGINGGTAVMQQLTANGTPSQKSREYPRASNPQNVYCGEGRIAYSLGGWERVSYLNVPWASALYINCGTLALTQPGDWFGVSSNNLIEVAAGRVETYYVHRKRGPFCGTASDALATGLYAQAGGSGLDGINVYCGRLIQSRFAAEMTFANFSWDKTVGASGWRVNLNLNGELLQNTAGVSGANKTPYTPASPNNAASYAEASEIFVLPNSGYQASVSARPATVASGTSFVVSGTCVTGISLVDRQDATCQMTVTGRPDLAVSVVNPPQIYREYNTPQNMVVGVKNVGPGASAATDGYAVTLTLPTGWTAQNLPAGCALTGQVVRCVVGALTAAPAAGQDGGSVQFTIPVLATTSANGSQVVTARLDTSVPSADTNPANDDYNTANNTAEGRVELIRNALLRLSKQWVNAVVNDRAVVTATSPNATTGTLNSTAETANETDTSTGVPAVVGAVYSLSETLGAANVGGYNASSFTCSGGSLSGSQLTIRAEDSGRDISCSITNTRRSADVRVTKTSNTPSVRSGQDIVWTVTVVNNGPAAADNAVLRDQAGEGMDCTIVPPACTASNGASCPANLTAATLASGVTLPQLPNGGQVVIRLTCRATASGI